MLSNTGFAASRSCQTPYSQSPCTCPWCNRCQSLGTQDTATSPCTRSWASVGVEGTAPAGGRAHHTQPEQTPRKRSSSPRIFCQQLPLTYNRKHLACISLERDDQPALHTAQNFWDAWLSKSICSKADAIYGFVDVALQHYNSVTTTRQHQSPVTAGRMSPTRSAGGAPCPTTGSHTLTISVNIATGTPGSHLKPCSNAS